MHAYMYALLCYYADPSKTRILSIVMLSVAVVVVISLPIIVIVVRCRLYIYIRKQRRREKDDMMALNSRNAGAENSQVERGKL